MVLRGVNVGYDSYPMLITMLTPLYSNFKAGFNGSVNSATEVFLPDFYLKTRAAHVLALAPFTPLLYQLIALPKSAD